MSTDYQTARETLGARLRELRLAAGLSGRGLAELLGWSPSKISKLEHGRQTAVGGDVQAWTRACGAAEVADELLVQLRTLETHYTSWRRQLATGTQARQRAFHELEKRSRAVRNFESACVPGLLQTPDYARHILRRTVELHGTPNDVEEGVRARLRRQRLLAEPHRRFEFLLWEPALRLLICPAETMAGQLDRIAGLIGAGHVRIGIVPTNIEVTAVPTHGFWLFDDELVLVETIGAELRLADADAITPYRRVFTELGRVAAHGHAARRVLARIRRELP
ncbi:helix-turn-helix domain-containing protein [Marinactinospora rubrisoli]|uniref:Helix-turn-helix domain-containing protein n=1 Tax=Marinactinospora rubrisoli TaxID=2715399 RepID=A0ABW2KJB2_9ACTN